MSCGNPCFPYNGPQCRCASIYKTNIALGSCPTRVVYGTCNTIYGINAGLLNSGDSNTFVGGGAGQFNTTGSANTFNGCGAGLNTSTGGENTFLGEKSGFQNTTGEKNTFVGEGSGNNNISGNNNVLIGQDADVDSSLNTYNNVVVIGSNTRATTSNQNVIGANITPVNTNVSTFISPIRSENPEALPTLHYNPISYEITYGSFDVMPPGLIIPYAGVNTPSGYILCNGQAISRTAYARLFSIISTLYGSGNGTTTFNVPDLRSRFPIGAGQGTGLTNRPLASTGGLEAITDVPAHTHTSNANGGSQANPGYGLVYFNGQNTANSVDSSANEPNLYASAGALVIDSTGLPSVPVVNPYLAINYIIKC